MTRRRPALVTGSAGFVGRHVCRALNDAGYYVVGIDLVDGGNALDFFRTVIDDRFAAWRPALVIHAAAVVGGRTMIDGRPLELAAIDLELDAAMFRWAQIARPGRVVYLSSSAAYPVHYQTHAAGGRALTEDLIDHRGSELGMPDATYGLVKLVGERLALEAAGEGIRTTVVRPFSGYGSDQALDYPFPSFIARARRFDDPFEVWGDGRQVRDFIHIDDIVRAIIALVDLGVDGAVNLGTGRPTSFLDLADLVTGHAGYLPEVKTLPGQPVGVEYRVADTALMSTFYEPRITLEQGIAEALR